jgi:hypothetical protein
MTTIEKLKALVIYLGISPKRIELNPNWGTVIAGRRGFIRAGNGHWIVVVKNVTRRYSSFVRKKLRFMTMGCLIEVVDNPLSDAPAMRTMEFRLDRMPTENEAAIVRKVLQIPRKRKLSKDAKAALVQRFAKARFSRQGTKSVDVLRNDELAA